MQSNLKTGFSKWPAWQKRIPHVILTFKDVYNRSRFPPGERREHGRPADCAVFTEPWLFCRILRVSLMDCRLSQLCRRNLSCQRPARWLPVFSCGPTGNIRIFDQHNCQKIQVEHLNDLCLWLDGFWSYWNRSIAERLFLMAWRSIHRAWVYLFLSNCQQYLYSA